MPAPLSMVLVNQAPRVTLQGESARGVTLTPP